MTVRVDVVNYFTKSDPAGLTLRALLPGRLAAGVGIPAGASYTLAPLGKSGIPASNVDAVSVSMTVTSTAAGALVSYPSGTTAPGTRTVGFGANDPATASTVAKLGADGKLLLRNTGTAAATVDIDVYGYFGKGLRLTALDASPSDSTWPEGTRVNSTTPTLSALASAPGGDPVSYTFEVAPCTPICRWPLARPRRCPQGQRGTGRYRPGC